MSLQAVVENAWSFYLVIRTSFPFYPSKAPVLPAVSSLHRPMHFCLSHGWSLQRLLRSGRSDPREHRPQSSFRSCLARPPEPQRPKKRVVFADRKGLALTSVHRFEDAVGKVSEEGSCPVSNFRGSAPPGSPEPTDSLGFPAPGRDSGGPQGPAHSEIVPGAVRCAAGLPVRRGAGTKAGLLEDSGDAHHLECLELLPGSSLCPHPGPCGGKTGDLPGGVAARSPRPRGTFSLE